MTTVTTTFHNTLPPAIRDWRGTITTGSSSHQRVWNLSDRWHISGPELVERINPATIRPRDRGMPKDGSCYVGGTLKPQAGLVWGIACQGGSAWLVLHRC